MVFTVFIITHTIQVHTITDDYSPPIWMYTFIARQADGRAITGTEFYIHREMTKEIYLHWMILEHFASWLPSNQMLKMGMVTEVDFWV